MNLCSGRAISIRSLGKAAINAVGGDEALLEWGTVPYRSDENMRLVGDAALISKVLGWCAVTTLKEGLALTADAERLRVDAVKI